MEIIFMNSKYGGRPNPRRLLLDLSNKINLNRKDKYTALSMEKDKKTIQK